MALELAGESDGLELAVRPPATDAGEDTCRAPRLPRWTRQEILVLIQGKRVAESKVRRIRTVGAPATASSEPKWSSVSSYCRKHGVNRGPVQCRKRWSNLAGDYKKIKEWETLVKKDPSESFWSMRNDLRRERKLPGFFDKEVFDILDSAAAPLPEEAAPAPAEEEAEESGAMFDCRRGAAPEDGMFSDFEQDETHRSPEKDAKEVPARIPAGIPAVPISGASNPETGPSQEGKKRKRLSSEGDEENSLQSQLIDVLEKNGKAIASHLDEQSTNLKLDREQRKSHSESLVAVLNKLADAMVRISEKL